MSTSSPETASLILKVLTHYFPDWEPPPDKREWVSCLCPFHGDSRPSATVSYINDAFACFTCGVKGSAVKIIMREEGISYTKAVEFAEGILPGSHNAVRGKPARKPGRRSFGKPGDVGSSQSKDRDIPSGVRGRATPWS